LRQPPDLVAEDGLHAHTHLSDFDCGMLAPIMTLNRPESLVLVGTFCASLLGSGVVRQFALRTSLLDIPNSRSSHSVPTPRGGGLAIVVAFIAGSFTLTVFGILDSQTMLAIMAGALIAWIGYMDDRRPQSAKLRFSVHILGAAIAVIILNRTPGVSLYATGTTNVVLFSALTVFAFAWATNLFNFMDGIDGLASSEAIFVSCSVAILNSIKGGDAGVTSAMLCLSAAVLGFLLWNWPPARLFMGDVGSGFLGFTLVLLAMVASLRGTLSLFVLPILGGLFLVDASVTLIRRMLKGEAWFEAHRAHAYQHLARRWRAHLPVTLLASAINLLWLFPLALCAALFPSFSMLFLAIALAPLTAASLVAGAGKHYD
jgi:Fuc2NAc and GlcNAc transferase